MAAALKASLSGHQSEANIEVYDDAYFLNSWFAEFVGCCKDNFHWELCICDCVSVQLVNHEAFIFTWFLETTFLP